MSGYSHLTAEERDRLAGLMADGLSLRSIAKALGRAASTISREIGRNALESGAYRPHMADGAYMLRRQRRARLETDAKLAAYVTDRLAEGSLSLIALQSSVGQRDARADLRTAAARDRERPAGRLRGDDLRLDLPGRPEDGAAMAFPDQIPRPSKEARRPGLQGQDLRENPYFSPI